MSLLLGGENISFQINGRSRQRISFYPKIVFYAFLHKSIPFELCAIENIDFPANKIMLSDGFLKITRKLYSLTKKS